MKDTISIRQLNDEFLHNLTRHTNMNPPYSNYVQIYKFPAQNTELLNTEVTIKYRDYYKYDNELLKQPATIKNFDGTEISSRPSDDLEQLVPQVGPETYDEDRVFESKFRVLRADAEMPYRMIAINRSGSRLLVTSCKPTDNGYEYEDLVVPYPIQRNEFIGLLCLSQYFIDKKPDKNPMMDCVTLRVDAGEPCYDVTMEYIDADTVRFTLGDEHYTSLYEPGVYNQYTDDQVADYRINIIEGKIIYGSV